MNVDKKLDNLDKNEKLITIGKSVLGINSKNINTLRIKELYEDNAIYMYQDIRGGGSVIIASDCSFLYFASCINFDKAIEDFRKGVRSNK